MSEKKLKYVRKMAGTGRCRFFVFPRGCLQTPKEASLQTRPNNARLYFRLFPSMLRAKKGTDIIRFKVNSGGWTAKGGAYIESNARAVGV